MAAKPGALLNSYSKAADKTEFDITTAERSNPFAALYNGVKLYLHKDACCSCGETSVPNVAFSWETGTESGVPFIAIGIVDGAGYTTDQIVNVGYLVQDQSGNEVWTGFTFDPDDTLPHYLDTTNLVDTDDWTITFSVSGVKTDLGCTPKLVYSVTIEAVSGDSGSTEYFLNRNATPWDAVIDALNISPSGAGRERFYVQDYSYHGDTSGSDYSFNRGRTAVNYHLFVYHRNRGNDKRRLSCCGRGSTCSA
jgi:hypothetical protein